MATSSTHNARDAVPMDAAMFIFDEADEVVILVAGGLCLAVSKRTRWDAAWHWAGWRIQARWGRC